MANFDDKIKEEEFENSPLAIVYYNVLSELIRERTGEETARGNGRINERRAALWVAWESHRIAPILEEDNAQRIDLLTMVGLPKKQKDFAKLLGVSARTIRNYAAQYSHFVSTAQEMGVQRVLSRYDLPVLHALGLSAAMPDGRNASDRRTFLTVRGFLVDKQDVNLATRDDGMTVEEWRDQAAQRRQQAAETAALFSEDLDDDSEDFDVGTED